MTFNLCQRIWTDISHWNKYGKSHIYIILHTLNRDPVGVGPFEFGIFGVFACELLKSFGVNAALYGLYDVFICNLVIPPGNAVNDDADDDCDIDLSILLLCVACPCPCPWPCGCPGVWWGWDECVGLLGVVGANEMVMEYLYHLELNYLIVLILMDIMVEYFAVVVVVVAFDIECSFDIECNAIYLYYLSNQINS